ncbi:hypothetical protein BJX63DRAFT_426365 [Aspergillus granulosus]|uniref:Zn(2)-C6 fungal-type domain-containing protein n=1 Tax=Aspergillus granulosus TaxID=176169 RepID=A0ABR4GSL1_9EURO
MLPQSSNARLRTRSGCADCHRHRKKCDERRPQCGGCTWNGLELFYPGYCLSPPVSMPEPFHTDQHGQLYRYFASSIMPRLIRQTSLSRYSVDSHLLRLALGHAPLMAALVSIAAMWAVPQSHHQVSIAVASYLFAINALKKEISNGVFVEYDSLPNPGCHVKASGRILSIRTPSPRNSPQELLVFERVCIESFLYHAVLMSPFDSSVDCHSIISNAHPDELGPSASSSTQPVLGASYKFFVFLSDLVQLARTSLTPDANHFHDWVRLRDEYLRSQMNYDGAKNELSNSIETLYAISIDLLLLLTGREPYDRFSHSFETLLQRGMSIIAGLEIDTLFSYYYLRPLLLIGSVTVDQAHRETICEKVVRASEARQAGPVLLAKNRLEMLWNEGTQYERFHIES